MPLLLPQHDPEPRRRAAEVRKNAEHYRYERGPHVEGLPPWMVSVPVPETRRSGHYAALGRLTDIARKLWSCRLSAGPRMKMARTLRRGPYGEADPFAPYRALFPDDDLPWIARDDVWKTDEAFGYQRLVGIAPLYLERVDSVPESFHVGDRDVRRAPAWPRGATLQDKIGEGRVWMVRHPEAHGIESKPGTVMCSPQSLFLVRDDGKLVPVAIQLFIDEPTVFTPADDVDAEGRRTNRWLVAKMFCSNVDALVYTLFTHTTLTHLLVETYWGALCRQLSERHPVRAFMAPHTELTHLIGGLFRSYYAKPKGELVRLHQASFDGAWQLLRRCYANWSFAELDIPAMHRRRGLDGAHPPGYYFRDDSLRHYRLIEQYCSEACAIFYADEGAVEADEELQAWVSELADPREGCGIRGLPTDADGTLRSRGQLVKLLAGAIYQAVVQHSHVDNAAFTYFGFAPNLPLSLYLQPPRDHEVRYTEQEIADGLPPVDDAVLQYALPYGNHPFHPQPRHPLYTSFLTEYPHDYMRGLGPEDSARFRKALWTWRRGLEQLGAQQEERDCRDGTAPYRFLHHTNMSNSIWY